MSPLRALSSWRGPPLAWQILGLLVGGLVVAQLVTLFLTMVLPPAPAPQYRLDDIAAALRGRVTREGARGLERRVQNGPPDLAGPGWLRSERSRDDLAALLGTPEEDVALAFFTPLPFAGALSPERRDPEVSLAMPEAGFHPASYVMLVDDGPPGGGGNVAGGGFPGGGAMPWGTGMPGRMPGQGFPAGGRGFPNPRGGDIGVGGMRDDRSQAGRGQLDGRILRDDSGNRPGDRAGAGDVTLLPRGRASSPTGVRQGNRSGALDGDSGGPALGDRNVAGPPRPAGADRPSIVQPRGQIGGFGGYVPVFPGLAAAEAPADVQRTAPIDPLPAGPPRAQEEAPPRAAVPPHSASPTIAPTPIPLPQMAIQHAPPFPQARTPGEALVAVPLRAPPRGLFGLAPAPFVEGDFVAALRQPDGRWAVVQPVPEPFPSAWQRRLMLWFAVALAIVGPLGLLFARRLVRPLSGFATAAEQLGRDPSAAVLPLAGPAEIGRAANAFNLMQSRLRAFVDDRTAMVGAISHDLRTPLTRMRFRIEEVEDEGTRAGMIGEVEEMEAMIASVLDYIRDASTPGVRERLDLRILVDDVVDDALMVGSDVAIERVEAAPVEVDVLGMRRVLDNLLGNAIKYGVRARVRLRTDADEAVAEILDDGPGLPDEELERVFEPFYRTPDAIASDKKGSGLGLAVCRSIARAHGGDVRLVRSEEGFLAQVRVPLAYGAERQAA